MRMFWPFFYCSHIFLFINDLYVFSILLMRGNIFLYFFIMINCE